MSGGQKQQKSKNPLMLFFFCLCVCFSIVVVVFFLQAVDEGGREVVEGGGQQAGPTYIDSPMESSSSRDKGR